MRGDEKTLSCDRDEWPPAYFVSRASRNNGEWGQRVRWIPAEENSGAASLWNSFCAKEDHGYYNGQRERAPKRHPKHHTINEPEDEYLQLKLNNKLTTGKMEVRNEKGPTVTHYYDKVTYTRAVWELAFDWGDQGPPSEKNEWYLEDNPCWPLDIAPDDPGFVLMKDDPWYDKHADAKKTVGLYEVPPSKERKDEADKRREARIGPEPPAKKPKLDPGSSPERRHLELVGGVLHIRDDASNSTRPLTDDEVRNNVEITSCKDRHCSRERAEHGGNEDDSLYIPGAGPPSTPSANLAVPTLVTSFVPEPMVKRSSVSPNLPLITASG